MAVKKETKSLWDKTVNSATKNILPAQKQIADNISSVATKNTPGQNETKNNATSNGSTSNSQAPKYNFTYEDFQAPDAYTQAMAAINEKKAQMPQIKGTYLDSINDTLNKILNREEFKYDVNGDALYQQYKDNYTQQGKMAMMDTMGQAAAFTGGYGNSYASTVGNQAYQAHLQQLNDVVPELYQLAYQKYQDEGNALNQQLAMYQDLDAREYSKDMDAINRHYNDLAMMQDEADKIYDRAYTDWSNDLNFRHQLDRERIEDERYLSQEALQKAQLAAELGDLKPLQNLGYDTSNYKSADTSDWLKSSSVEEIKNTLSTAESEEELGAMLDAFIEKGMPEELALNYLDIYSKQLGFDESSKQIKAKIDDIAEKLNRFAPGYGDAFLRKINQKG